MYIYMDISIYLYIYIHICIYIWIYIYVHIYVHIHMYIHIYIHMNIHIDEDAENKEMDALEIQEEEDFYKKFYPHLIHYENAQDTYEVTYMTHYKTGQNQNYKTTQLQNYEVTVCVSTCICIKI